MMSQSTNALTMEQQFKLRVYDNAIARMSAEQARDSLRDALRLMMMKDNAVKQLLKQSVNQNTTHFA